MKKELFAAALLVLILALALWNTREIGDLCGEIAELVERSADEASRENWPESQRLFEDALALWQSRESYTGIVLRHTDIETLTDDFYELSEHLRTRDAPAALSAASLVREHLRGIAEIESFALGSIF